MAISLRTDLVGLSTLRHLEASQLDLRRATRRIASGLRIQEAADDPAGLAMADQLRARVRRYDQGIRNVRDGTSVAQIADGALEKVSLILDRLRVLAAQSATDLVTDVQRESLAAEFEELKSEIDRIAETTSFGGRALLDGTFAAVEDSSLTQGVVVGAVAQVGTLTQAETITFEDFGLFAGIPEEQRQIEFAPGIGHFDLANQINADPILGTRVRAASYLGRLELSTRSAGSDAQFLVSSNLTAASNTSGLGEVVLFASGTDDTVVGGGVSIQAGIDARPDDQISLDLAGSGTAQLGVIAARIETVGRARAAIPLLAEVAATVTGARARIGASLRRLDAAASNLQTLRDTNAAAHARVRDADVAQETATLVRAEILVSAGVSVLAQANVFPDAALQLLASTAPAGGNR